MKSVIFFSLISFFSFSQYSVQSSFPNVDYSLPQGISKKFNSENSNLNKDFSLNNKVDYMESKSFQSEMMIQNENDITYKLDNQISVYFDENDLTNKYTSQYDENGRQTVYITYDFKSDTDSFVPRYKREYSYYENGYLSLILQYDWDLDNESFVSRSKTEYSFDENGNQTSRIESYWNTESQSLVPQSKYEDTYDVNGNQTSHAKSFYDTASQSLVPSYKYEYTYNENGNQIFSTNLLWDSGSQSFFINSKDERVFDSNGRLIQSTNYQSRTTSIAGSWKLAQEVGALGVGPVKDDISWWANTSNDIITRGCLFDDEFVFNEDGTFVNVLGADTWIEPWQGPAVEGCAAPVFPHDGTATASYTFDEKSGSITINGVGAYLGLSKAYNGGELQSPEEAKDEITYLAELSPDGRTLDLDIEISNGAYWSFKLVRDVVAVEQQALFPNSKFEFFYDSLGRQYNSEYFWDSILEIFLPAKKQYSEFDEEGRSTLINGYEYNICTSDKIGISKTELIYDDVLNGQTFRAFRKDNNGDFVFSYEIGRFYDDNSRLVKRTQFVDLDYYNSGYYWSYENTYDDNGNLIEKLNSKWNTERNAFEPYKRELRTYDDNFYPNNLIQFQIDKYYSGLGVYKPSFKKDYSIHSETDTQLVIVGITKQYDVNFNTWTELDGEEFKSYRYYTKESSLSTNSLETNSFSIYPNPTSNTIHINSSEQLKKPLFELYDIKGSLLLSNPFKFTEPINLRDLQPSMYIYNIKDGNEVKQTGKILIE